MDAHKAALTTAAATTKRRLLSEQTALKIFRLGVVQASTSRASTTIPEARERCSGIRQCRILAQGSVRSCACSGFGLQDTDARFHIDPRQSWQEDSSALRSLTVHSKLQSKTKNRKSPTFLGIAAVYIVRVQGCCYCFVVFGPALQGLKCCQKSCTTFPIGCVSPVNLARGVGGMLNTV